MDEEKKDGRRNSSRHPRECETFMECPYNFAHYITSQKFLTHLEKCRQNYKDQMKEKNREVEIISCRYNWAHKFPKPEIRSHEKRCPDRHNIVPALDSHAKEAARKRWRSPTPPTQQAPRGRKRIPFHFRHNHFNRNNAVTNITPAPAIVEENWDLCTKDTPNYDPNYKPPPIEMLKAKQIEQKSYLRNLHARRGGRRDFRRKNWRRAPPEFQNHQDNSVEAYKEKDSQNSVTVIDLCGDESQECDTKIFKQSQKTNVTVIDLEECENYHTKNSKPSSNRFRRDVYEYDNYYPRDHQNDLNYEDDYVDYYQDSLNYAEDYRKYYGYGEYLPDNPSGYMEEYIGYYYDDSPTTSQYAPSQYFEEYENYCMENSRRSRNSSRRSNSPGGSCFYYRRDGQDQSESFNSDPESEWDNDVGDSYPPQRISKRSNSSSSRSIKNNDDEQEPWETESIIRMEDEDQKLKDKKKNVEIEEEPFVSYDWDEDAYAPTTVNLPSPEKEISYDWKEVD